MARDKIIAGIDIGTAKITTIITSLTETDQLRVIGIARN